ncbi:Hypothetical predicted protein [Lecanosticta acicola]|uniref:Uncharacterized protein n=1 Tax=Lecanosticta acicola TaxID=111012 RepID=A0AAI9E5Z1_9PEZI|nr:Hypothetical predicted protein [Lecanosticta acicola]
MNMTPNDLRQHVLLPIPSFKAHKRPEGREDMLRTIIQNIETQQQQVRNNIIAAGEARLNEQKEHQQRVAAAAAAVSRPSSSDSADAMDLDVTTAPLSDGEIIPAHPNGHHHHHHHHNNPSDHNGKNSGINLFLANLSAPVPESGRDPCVPADGSLPPPPPGVRQATPPLEIQVAKETLDRIAEYELHSQPAKEHYEKALERMRRGSTGVPPIHHTSNAPSSGAGPPSASSHGAGGSVANPIDSARDPR